MRKTYLRIINVGLALSFIGFQAKAQTPSRCGTSYSHEHSPEFVEQQKTDKARFELFMNNADVSRESATPTIMVEIPIVIHLLTYSGVPASNISDAKIKSQIDILNADFGKTNSNLSDVVSTFKNLAADTKIRFKLATVDPQGNPTTGIIRKASAKKMFAYETHDEKYASKGGDDPWDQTKYLNVWIVNDISYGGVSSGLLGRGQFPDDPTKRNDGLTVRYYAWGNVAPVQAPYHLGRTATHEIGHWLGLKHPWGLKEGDCDGSDDDGISDTPLQSSQSGGNTSPYPTSCTLTKKTCNVLNMTQNFMDYTDDQCLALFTTGQVARMKYVMETYRAAMLPVITNFELEEVKSIVIYPNPNNTNQISLSKQVDIASIIDLQGRVVKSVSNTAGFSLSNEINTGLYFLKLEMNGHTNITKLIIE